MRRLRLLDAVLLGTLLPLWLVCFGLHLRQLVHTGFALPPAFATPAGRTDDYPRVGGLRPETFISEPGLRVGDRLLRAGNVDLRGVGYIGFYAAVLDQAGSDLSVPVEFERAGQRAVIELPLSRVPVPWFRVPGLMAIVFTCVLVLLRAPQVSQGRLFFAACMTFAIIETPFDGGPPIQTWASQLVFFFAGGLAALFVPRWALLFPEDVNPSARIAPAWAWLSCVLWYAVHGSFFLGGPIPTPRLPAAALGIDVMIGIGVLGALTWNYRHAQPIGRRRIKWVLLGQYVGTVTLFSTVVLNLADPHNQWLQPMLLLSTLALPALAAGFLIGIIRYNLFDIDRLISATTAYSTALFALLASGIIAAPLLAAPISRLLDTDPASVEIVLAIGLASLLVPAQRPLRRWVDRLFFTDRFAFLHGITQLLRELSACETPRALLTRAGEALDDLLHPTACVVSRCSGRRCVPMLARGRQAPSTVAGDSPLVAALAHQSGPMVRKHWTQRRRTPVLSALDRAALETLGAELIVPVHRRSGLSAFICLGGKRSGDVYTATELTLLAVVSDKLASELDRLSGARTPPSRHLASRLALESAQAVAEEEQLEEVIEFAIAQCREALAAEGAAVLLVDAGRQLLYFPYVADEDTEVAARLRTVRFPHDCGIAGAVWRSGEPSRVDDVAADPRFFPGVDAHSGRPTRALLCAPLIAGDETLGVIEAVNPLHRRAFDDRDLGLLVALAGNLAATIAAMQHRSQELRATRPDTREMVADTITGDHSAADTRPGSVQLFRKEGDYWSITYDGTTFRLKDTRGLHHLAHLLRHPGQEFHALDLVMQTGPAPTRAGGPLKSADQPASLDATAKAAYRRRLDDLRDELAEAERNSDAGRAARAREEIEFIGQQLAGAMGLGGRDRPSGSAAERARLAVTKGIKAAVEKVRSSHPALAHHLATSIKTGYFCSYTSDPGRPVTWVD